MTIGKHELSSVIRNTLDAASPEADDIVVPTLTVALIGALAIMGGSQIVKPVDLPVQPIGHSDTNR